MTTGSRSPTTLGGAGYPGAPTRRRAMLAPMGRLIIVVLAMIRRDLAQGRLIRIPFLLDIAYGAMNLLIFLFISRVLHHRDQQGLGGSATYFDFVALGLAFMVVAQVTCTQLIARVQDERANGTLEVLAGSPITTTGMALGLAAYPTMVGMIRSLVYLLLACILLGVDAGRADWPAALLVMAIGAVAVAALGIGVAAIGIAFQHGQAANRALLVGLGFLSGAYFPTTALPVPARDISALLPTRMAIDGLRAAVDGGSWVPVTGMLAAATALILPVSILLFKRALGRSVRKGTLARG